MACLTCAHFIADLLRHEIVQVAFASAPRELLTLATGFVEMPSGEGRSARASVLGQMADIDTLTLTTDALLQLLISRTDMCQRAQRTLRILATDHRDIALAFHQRQSKGTWADNCHV